MRFVSKVVFISLALTTSAYAQSTCSDVLAVRLANTSTSLNSREGLLAAKHYNCSRSKQDKSVYRSGSGGFQFGLKQGNLEGKEGDMSGSESASCGASDFNQHDSALVYYSQSINSEAINAWSRCMSESRQLACWASKNDSESVIIHIRWGLITKNPEVTWFDLKVGGKRVQSSLKSGSKLLLEDNLIAVDRSPRESIVMGLQATSDGVGGKTCVLWVPPEDERPIARDEPIDDPELIAKWESSSGFSQPPPQGMCKCLVISQPGRPNVPPGPTGPPPYGAQSELRVRNNCSSPVDVHLQQETIMQQFPPPWAPAPGRYFLNASLKRKQELVASLAGFLPFGYLAVRNCPSKDFLGPPGGPGPNGGGPFQ